MSSGIPRGATVVALLAAAGLLSGGACRGTSDLVLRPSAPSTIAALTLRGQFSIPSGTRIPPRIGLRFGGLSSLAPLSGGSELLAVADDHLGLRVYHLAIVGHGAEFRVEVRDQIPLDGVPSAMGDLDPEGLALLPNGNLLVSSEGIGHREPRMPPAILEFGRYGSFVRALPIRDRYRPTPTGPLTWGVRPNKGLESLTIAPGGGQVFAGVETSLVQDGEETTFEHGAPARLLEYVRDGDTYRPRAEFVYMVEPIFRPPFQPGLAVNGLVELLALDEQRLLALERSFVEEAGGTRRNMNRIRLFNVSLRGATDVSGLESLAGTAGVVPVTKTLLLDLSDVAGLSNELAPGLDNFEGMAFTAPLADGRPGFVLVSDDNFNPTQRTWFLQFAVDGSR